MLNVKIQELASRMPEELHPSQNPVRWPIKRTIFGTGIVILIWALWPEVIKFFRGGSIPNGLPELGDAYGSINSLFSGVAMIGAIVAIFMQWKELRMQREDLKVQWGMLEAQLNEAKEQRNAVEQQAAAMKKLADETAAQNQHLEKQNDIANEDLKFRIANQIQQQKEAQIASLPRLEIHYELVGSKFKLLNRGPTIYSVLVRTRSKGIGRGVGLTHFATLGTDQSVPIDPPGFRFGTKTTMEIPFKNQCGDWLIAIFHLTPELSEILVSSFKRLNETDAEHYENQTRPDG